MDRAGNGLRMGLAASRATLQTAARQPDKPRYLPDFGFDLSENEEVAEGFGFSAFGFLGSRLLRCWPLAICCLLRCEQGCCSRKALIG